MPKDLWRLLILYGKILRGNVIDSVLKGLKVTSQETAQRNRFDLDVAQMSFGFERHDDKNTNVAIKNIYVCSYMYLI